MDKATNRTHPVTQTVTIPVTHMTSNTTHQEDIVGSIKRQGTHTMVATDNMIGNMPTFVIRDISDSIL